MFYHLCLDLQWFIKATLSCVINCDYKVNYATWFQLQQLQFHFAPMTPFTLKNSGRKLAIEFVSSPSFRSLCKTDTRPKLRFLHLAELIIIEMLPLGICVWTGTFSVIDNIL